MWFLAVMIYGARYEIILYPIEVYDSQQLCEAWKPRTSKELGLPLVCIQGGEA